MAITPAEEKKSLNMKKLISVVLGMLLIAGAVWFFRTELKDIINKVPTKQVIVFPAVESRTIIQKDFDTASLALEMSRFIPVEAKERTYSKLKYTGLDWANNMGFEISYKLDANDSVLDEFYKEQLNVAKDNGWKLLAANLENSQVFLDIKKENPSADYKVRIFAENEGVKLVVRIQYLIIRDLFK